MDFPGRGYFSSVKEGLKVVIKNASGESVYEISGKYTELLEMKNLSTGEVTEVFRMPENYLPQNSEKMFHLSNFGLQLNMISDELRPKLPPTDVRHRKDMRAWESKNVAVGAKEKDRLENNQRARKKILKQTLNIKDGKDDTWYNPLWFKKVHHPIMNVDYYSFQESNRHGTNYWKARETGDWKNCPRIWDDDCEPFH